MDVQLDAFEDKKEAADQCDSPLGRGVGVCFAMQLNAPYSRTAKRAPSQEGNC